jgi:hypothetical protein
VCSDRNSRRAISRVSLPLTRCWSSSVSRSVSRALDDDAFAHAHTEGERLSLDAALAEALAVELPPARNSARTASGSAKGTFGNLTSTEMHVLHLLARGKTSREIAAELVVAVSTVENTAAELVAPVAGAIRQMAPQAEASRQLPDGLVTRLKEARLFSIYMPTDFGGMGLPLPSALEVVEEVARHDGSTGWVVALGVASVLFTVALSASSAARVLGNGGVLIAGAPAFGVRADRVDSG